MNRMTIVSLTAFCVLALAGCAEHATTRSRASNVPTTAATTSLSTIPAGTKIEVRANEEIVADKSAVGRTSTGTIANDVVNNSGQVLIPRGSPVTFVVLDTARGGVTGGGEVALGIQSVTVNGVTYAVAGSDVEKGEGLGTNRRTATMVGGGAVLGTLLGAIAGGGAGAAIGAAAGAAAGAGAQVLTQGRQIKIPAESVLTFQLTQDLHLRRR